MESTDSSMGSHQPQLPPGFRFHPTDEELVVHYLKKKAASAPLPVSIIAEVDLYKFDPWELPAKATFGEQEWYFFSPRDRKYPNGARPNRAATSGYWKATGTDKPVLTSGGTQKVGVKKALVFYGGKPPKGVKTNWIMHEYRLTENKPSNKPPGCDNKKNSLRLDDWVLCRIYQKHNAHRPADHDKDDLDDHHHRHHHHMLGTLPSMSVGQGPKLHFQNPKSGNYGALLENEHNMFDGMLGNHMLQHQTGAGLSLKRTAPLQPMYWSDADPSTAATTSGKKYHADGTVAEEGNSSAIATLLGQLPQTPSQMHQQTMLGSLGDGVFRPQFQLPGMNWYS